MYFYASICKNKYRPFSLLPSVLLILFSSYLYRGLYAACGWLLPIIRSIICAISPAGIRIPSSTQVTIIPCIPAVAYRLL